MISVNPPNNLGKKCIIFSVLQIRLRRGNDWLQHLSPETRIKPRSVVPYLSPQLLLISAFPSDVNRDIGSVRLHSSVSKGVCETYLLTSKQDWASG